LGGVLRLVFAKEMALHLPIICTIAGAALMLSVPAHGERKRWSETSDDRITVISPKPNSNPATPNFLDPNASVELSPPKSDAVPAAPIRTLTIRREDSVDPSSGSGGFVVQIAAQKTEAEARAAFHALQSKYPHILGAHQPIFRQTGIKDLGAFHLVAIGPFASSQQAANVCADLKTAGGQCIVHKNGQ
jgi:cell division septation protein DedD